MRVLKLDEVRKVVGGCNCICGAFFTDGQGMVRDGIREIGQARRCFLCFINLVKSSTGYLKNKKLITY